MMGSGSVVLVSFGIWIRIICITKNLIACSNKYYDNTQHLMACYAKIFADNFINTALQCVVQITQWERDAYDLTVNT